MTRLECSRPAPRIRPWLLMAVLVWPSALPAAPRVVTSIGPVHALAAAIMGELGTPVQIVRGYGSPHAYQMRPSDAANLRDADLVLWIGPELETFLQRPLSARREGTVVVSLMEVPGLKLLAARGGGVWHDDAHASIGHEHEAYDAHIWLSPFNARVIAAAIAAELRTLDPGNAQIYRANLDRLTWRIDAMETHITERLAPLRTIPFVVFHDAFQYFEESFGLNAVGSVTVSPDRMPSARRIRELREEIAQTGARCVFREPQFESALVQILIEGSGARAGILDPLGTDIAPGRDAYFELMDASSDALVDCLTP